jgi:hypothetical protein
MHSVAATKSARLWSLLVAARKHTFSCCGWLLYHELLACTVADFAGVWCGSVVAVKVIQVKQPSALTFPNRPPTSHQQRSPGADLRSHPLGDAAAAETAATAGPSEIDSQAAQVALELAQHEYESWLNANLRHPNIVQLFTSFTIGLQEHTPAVPMLSCGGKGDMSRGALQVLGEAGGSGGLSWKTHLVMEYCELGTMQVSNFVSHVLRTDFASGSALRAGLLCKRVV